MAGISKREDVKSPQEVEDGIKSTSTVNWDPFTVLPKELYVKIFDMLDSSTDKLNFMNAHMKFYDLFESNRTLLLFEDVLKEIQKKEEQPNFNDYQQCRLVCKNWDNAAQKFFQMHDNNFKMEQEKDIWVDFPLTFKNVKLPCKEFYWPNRSALEKDLNIFSLTHPPSKNPFFSRNVCFVAFDWDEIDQGRNYWTSVDTLLQKYGHHIWHCRINIYDMFIEGMDREPFSCIAKWLEWMPELKTLEIYNEDYLSKDELETIQDMQVVQPALKNLEFLKSYELEAVPYNKLFGNLKGLEKIEVQFNNKEESLRNFAISKRENLKEAFFSLNGLQDFKYLQDSEPLPNLKKLVTRF